MKSHLIKKTVIIALAASVVGMATIPGTVFAKNYKDNLGQWISSVAKYGGKIFNKTINPAKQAYEKAVKDAQAAYSKAVNLAHSKLVAALKTAKDQASRVSALKTYLSEVLAATKTRDSARQAALQQYIDSLSGIIITNQAPVATAQNITMAKNVSTAITLAGSDPENSTLTFSLVTNPSHGVLSGTVPNLTYMPSTDFTGADSFTFRVYDGALYSATAAVSITVVP